MAKMASYRVLTSFQDGWVSHDKGAVVEIDEEKMTPGENLKKMTDAEIKVYHRKRDTEAAVAESGVPADEMA